ncbi:MAG: hypothetical protein EXS36_12250 [Pedosphaera sp.]|nr:hypothetical protein [Pedosphaera sp.]
MNWKRMLTTLSGSLDQELILRNEFWVTENRILKNQIKGRLRLTDPERNHQGKGNVILFPALEGWIGEMSGNIKTRERLGGLLTFYYRDAA